MTERRRRRGLGRVALLLGGVVLGILASALLIWWELDRARFRATEDGARVALGLPREAFELEAVEEDGALRVRLRDVAFLDAEGDTIVSAPSARARVLSRSLSTGPEIVVDEVTLERPFLRLVQRPDGEWNVFDIVAVEAAGAALAAPEEESRPIAFRGLRVVDGQVRIATPFVPPEPPMPGRFAALERPERVETAEGPYTVRWVRNLQATLPLVRVGPEGGWRAEVASLTADLTNPDTRIVSLAGWIQMDPDETIRFDLRELRTSRSLLAAAGRIRFPEVGAPVFDLEGRAAPLAFADLQGMGLPIPDEGRVEFDLRATSQPGGRTLWAIRDASAEVLNSRASGRLTVLTGGGDEAVFTDTRIFLDTLVLADLETLGYVEEPLPLVGTVRGEVVSLDAVDAGEGGPLRVDLTAALVPRGRPGAEPSVIAARGGVRWVPGDDPFRFDELQVEAAPLRLDQLAVLMETPPEWLRGTVTGSAVLSGSPSDLAVEGGTLSLLVDDAPPTVLAGLSGRFVAGDPVRWELAARAEPLALPTLTALFPALPFRAASLRGPISLTGVGDEITFETDLDGAAGALAATGSVTLGEPLRFDVEGRVEAFRTAAILTTAPLEGPVSGTFEARGTVDDLRFAVDLRQPPLGRFAVGGTLRRQTGGEPYRFDVAGRVDDFRIGVLVGRPALIPGTLSGPIAVSGGGPLPIAFDVGLTGELGAFDVRGSYAPGPVPAYTVAGRIGGIDLSSLPGLGELPATRLSGTVDVDARGLTPETFAGRVAFDAAPGSTVDGLALEAGRLRLTAAEGVLTLEALELAIPGARVEASGTLGLTVPLEGMIRFRVDAPDLSVLAAVLPPPGRFEPELAGTLRASGWVAGSLRAPEVAFTATGSGLRYEEFRAGALTAQGRLARGAEQWTGSLGIGAQEVGLGTQTFRTVNLEANLAPDLASFGVDARRDADTDLRASGVLELDGLAVTGVVLRDLDLRLRDVSWTLAVPEARLAMEEGGIRVDSLHLERSGAATGFIAVDGRLPTTGTADLRVRAAGIDLAELGSLFPELPQMGGTAMLDAAILGAVDDPQLYLDSGVDAFSYGGVTLERVTVTGEYGGRTMRLDARATLHGRELLAAEASVPMTLTLGGLAPAFELLRDAPISATIRADSLPLQLVAASVPTLLERGEGAATGTLQLAGTLDRPQVSGSAGLRGAVTVVPLGVRWHDLDAALVLDGETIRVERAIARAGDGEARITGTILLDPIETPSVDLLVELSDFTAIDRSRVARLQADAGLRVGGRLPAAELRGWVRIHDGVIFIPELGEEAEPDIIDVDIGEVGPDIVAPEVATRGLFGGLLPRDLLVEIADNVWLQSREARIQLTGSLQVYEAAGAPRIYGDLQTVRGTYLLRLGPIQREFEIVQGTVQFAGTPELNPRLDISARHVVRAREPGRGDIAVLVNLGGTLENPTLSLSSDTRPPLPESELLTLLIFGRRGYELATIPQELTQGIILEQIVGGFLTREIEEAFARLGIFDYFRLRARPTGAGLAGGLGGVGTDLFAYATLEAGLHLGADAFLILEIVDLFSSPRPGVALEWRATETWTLRAAVSPVRRDPLLLNLQQRAYQATVEARRVWEYGRPPEMPDPLAEEETPPPEVPRPAEESAPAAVPPPQPRREERRRGGRGPVVRVRVERGG